MRAKLEDRRRLLKSGGSYPARLYPDQIQGDRRFAPPVDPCGRMDAASLKRFRRAAGLDKDKAP